MRTLTRLLLFSLLATLLATQSDNGRPSEIEPEQWTWLVEMAGTTDEARFAELAGSRPEGSDPEFMVTAAKSLRTFDARAAEHRLPVALALKRLAKWASLVGPEGSATYMAAGLSTALGKLPEARALLDDAIGLFAQSGDRYNEAAALLMRNWVHSRLGDTDGARNDIEAALTIFRELNSEREVAACAVQLANLEYEIGRPEAALALFREARDVFQRLDDAVQLGWADLGLGSCYVKLARFDVAESLLTTALEAARRRREAPLVGACLQQLGMLLTDQSRYTEALPALQEAVDVVTSIRDVNTLAHCRLAQAQLFGSIGYREQAAQQAQAARQDFLRLGDVRSANVAVLAQVSALVRLKMPENALEVLRQQRGALSADVDAGVRGFAAFWEATAMIALDQTAEALAILDRLLTEVPPDDPRLTANVLYARAEALAKLERHALALESIERGIAIVASLGTTDLLAQGIAVKAFLLRDTQAMQAAADAFEAAMHCSISARERASDPILALGQQAIAVPVAAAYADLLMDRGETPRAFELLQRTKAFAARQAGSRERTGEDATVAQRIAELTARYEEAAAALAAFRESGAGRAPLRRACATALAELDAYYASVRASSKSAVTARPTSLDDVERALGKTHALVEYAVGDRCVIAFVVRGGGPKIVATRLRVTQDALAEKCARFVEAVRSGSPSTRAKSSQAMYSLLLGPLEQHLKGVDRLVLAPDGALQTIPFGALIDPSGKYALERWATTSAPSASAWLGCRTTPRSRTDADTPALIVGVSKFHERSRLFGTRTASGPALSDLPHAAEEVALVGRALRPNVVLTNERATKAAVLSRLQHARILHFATHAIANDSSPLMSALVLSPAGERDSGLLYARDIYGLSLRAELALLSACGTATGAEVPGEGVVGLAWCFMTAGCPSTIAARWEIDDEAGRLWVTHLYKSLNSGISKDRAVQAASLSLLRSPKYSEPRSWAGWVLFGSDR